MRTEHGVLALALAGLAFATLNGDTTTPGGQAAGISLGLDVTTDGNTASALGTIDTYPRVKRRRFVRHRFCSSPTSPTSESERSIWPSMDRCSL